MLDASSVAAGDNLRIVRDSNVVSAKSALLLLEGLIDGSTFLATTEEKNRIDGDRREEGEP